MSDLIERDKVIEYCLKLIDVERKQGSDVMNYGQERINQTDIIIAFVENLPSARPKGEWIIHEHGFWTFVNDKGERDGWIPDYECNLCGSRGWKYADVMNFCPNCGASMREREGE